MNVTCNRTDNRCPSRQNCRLYTASRSLGIPNASLNHRREPGSSACDLFLPITVITTFKDAKP